jgi:sRNA-binding regulator protein Hfq
MLPRPFLLFCCFSVGFLLTGSAQDVLLKTDGQELRVWVTEVSQTYVRYFPADQSGEEEINVSRKEVARIFFESGEEEVLNPLLPTPSTASETTDEPAPVAATIPSAVAASTQQETAPSANDAVFLQNGETLRGKVTQINDTHIVVEVAGSEQLISQQRVRMIQYANGYREYYDEAAAISGAEISEPARQVPNAPTSTPRQGSTSASPVQSAISDARASYEAKRHKKSRSSLPIRWHVHLGGSRNTGLGVGQKEQELQQERISGELAAFESLSVQGQVRSAWGFQAGGGFLYPVNQQVAVQVGLQLALKGYPIEQSIAYLRTDSGQPQYWELQLREQQRLLQLDFPLGIEAQVLPSLFVQAGGVLGVFLRGESRIETTTQVSSEGGQVIASLSGLTEETTTLTGVGWSPGLYLGLGVPISSTIDINLRLQTHLSSGHPEAFTQTLLQAGLRFHWE